MRADGSVAVVNSRDVADLFEKRHDHVLRDIDAVAGTSPNLGKCEWFREVRTEHPSVSGRMDRSFDMTRDGFMLLVMDCSGVASISKREN